MEGLDIYAYCGYAQCWCEENTYRFIEKLALEPPAAPEGEPPRKYEAWAAFMTAYNAAPGKEVEPGKWSTAIPVVSGPKSSDVVYWDYHCVTVVKEIAPPKDGAGEPTITFWVVDFDTKMGKGEVITPIRYELFWGFTLSAAAKNAAARIEMRVRFIAAVDYLTSFRSDRRHMYLRSLTKDDRYKTLPLKELMKPANYQHPPPRQPCIQGASPAAGVLKGSWNRDHGKALLEKAFTAPVSEWKNDHLNNIAEILNVANTAVVVSDIVTVKELGVWMKAH